MRYRYRWDTNADTIETVAFLILPPVRAVLGSKYKIGSVQCKIVQHVFIILIISIVNIDKQISSSLCRATDTNPPCHVEEADPNKHASRTRAMALGLPINSHPACKNGILKGADLPAGLGRFRMRMIFALSYYSVLEIQVLCPYREVVKTSNNKIKHNKETLHHSKANQNLQIL